MIFLSKTNRACFNLNDYSLMVLCVCVCCDFSAFRRLLDGEMKDVTRAGLTITNKKEEKEAIPDEEEELFWEKKRNNQKG